ncbi:MAG: LPS export ABC transporter periplasmic protein LptC [Treponema sp.]|jgi:LPS export ABC transporter protein LptC|nr:LPS export ABC transporter periplasmic protein LptC [Treponema sp.]
MGKAIVRGPVPFVFLLIILGACSFDYGTSESDSDDQPTIIMRDVEYVRVRDGDPLVRFRAETAERYEKRQTMELQNFSFEQFTSHGEDINATGRAGSASVELDSGDIYLGGGVRIAVDSEDITIATDLLNWQDKERILSGEETAPVDIHRSDGTSFTGIGFSAHTRERTWNFEYGVSGSYVHEDDEEAAEEGEDLEGSGEISADIPAEAQAAAQKAGEGSP